METPDESENKTLTVSARLQSTNIRLTSVFCHLNFGQDGHDGHGDAEQEVEADEDFVLGAVVRRRIKHVEEHDGSERQRVEDEGEGQQGCERRVTLETKTYSLT